jgi:hypothetical protein
MSSTRYLSISFCPERVLFRPGGVNQRACLCDVPVYASAQPLDFLARTKNPRFPDQKPIVSHPEFPDGYQLDWKGYNLCGVEVSGDSHDSEYVQPLKVEISVIMLFTFFRNSLSSSIRFANDRLIFATAEYVSCPKSSPISSFDEYCLGGG